MSTLLLIVLIGLLSTLCFQDFKNREISWFLIPLLFITLIIKAVWSISVEELFYYFGINLLIVIFNLLGVSILVSLKEKEMTNILKAHLGLGDVLFFLVLTVAFSPINFVVFYLGSILITTVVYSIVIFYNREQKTLIPLAGAMSLLLIIVLLIENINPSVQCYNDIPFWNE